MKDALKASWGWLGKKIRTHFLAGILVILPIGLTVWIFVWIFTGIDDFIQRIAIRPIFGREIAGVGFAITVVLIYVVGLIASNVVGRRVIRYGESLLTKVPIARTLYTAFKQILESFSAPNKTGFMQVVLVEFPRRGTRTIGFITNEHSDESGRKLLNVFIQTAPNPTSGFLQILEEDEVIRTNISVDAALKMVVSGGRMSPKEVQEKLLAASEEARASKSGSQAVNLLTSEEAVPAREDKASTPPKHHPSPRKTT